MNTVQFVVFFRINSNLFNKMLLFWFKFDFNNMFSYVTSWKLIVRLFLDEYFQYQNTLAYINK